MVKARVNFGLLAIAVKLATIDMEYSMYVKKKISKPNFSREFATRIEPRNSEYP